MSSLYSVPIIDVAPFLVSDPVGSKEILQQVNRALERIGFLVLTGHGIDPELQDRTLRVAQAFFDLPEEEKLRYHNVPGTFMGYNPLAAERVAYSHGIERLQTSRPIIHWSRLKSTNMIPTTPARPEDRCFNPTSGRSGPSSFNPR